MYTETLITEDKSIHKTVLDRCSLGASYRNIEQKNSHCRQDPWRCVKSGACSVKHNAIMVTKIRENLDQLNEDKDVDGLHSSLNELIDHASKTDQEAHDTILAPAQEHTVVSKIMGRAGKTLADLAAKHNYGVYTIDRKTGKR